MLSKLRKPVMVAAAAVAIAAGATTLSAGEANAAPVSPMAYNGVCGSGYGVIDSHALTGGTIYLTYNGSTEKNCVVTVRSSPGSAEYMLAEVSLAGAPWNADSGNYTTYAGPVYVYAPHSCIDWGGGISSNYWSDLDTHCG